MPLNATAARTDRLHKLSRLALAGLALGCSERQQHLEPDWPPPDEIAQLRFDPPCLIVDRELKCWAWDAEADPVLLGRDQPFPSGPLPPVSLGGDVRTVETHQDFSRCAALVDGRVKCWGYNDGHVLALPDTDDVVGDEPDEWGASLAAIELGAGRALGVVSVSLGHCAWLEDGRVKCWGTSFAGSLGVPEGVVLGDEPDELGDNLPAVELGDDVRVVGLDGEGAHLCALTDDGRVKCWGANVRGQLGIGSTHSRGGDPEQMGDALPYVDLGTSTPVRQVSVGYQHSCVLLGDGRVKCWGSNSERAWNGVDWEHWDAGRLGVGDLDDRGDHPSSMGDSLAHVDLGEAARAVAISAGLYHTCALLDSGRLACWGANGSGQLGLGDDEDRGDEPGEMGDALPRVDLGSERTVRAFEVAGLRTCALLDDDSVKCWGTGVGDEPNEMGDALAPLLRANDLR